jgi:hypothetical protein
MELGAGLKPGHHLHHLSSLAAVEQLQQLRISGHLKTTKHTYYMRIQFYDTRTAHSKQNRKRLLVLHAEYRILKKRNEAPKFTKSKPSIKLIMKWN